MGLEEYRRKRDFDKTREPAGVGADGESPAGSTDGSPGLSFVIHKHAARQLHYDLRLELDGVLLSWAVPKGPSLDPSDKRLAMHVEDHPLEYGGFEGTIPAGEYGAGTVAIWDRGTWGPLEGGGADEDLADRARHGIDKGTLKFELRGEKLRGAWMLVRMKPRPGERGESWLLIKERDGHARPRAEYDVLSARAESVATGRSIDEIAAADEADGDPEADEPEPSRETAPAAPAAPDATGVPMQLATLSTAPPEGPGWLHEIKYDGYRLRIELADGAARVRTRGGEEWSDRFPALVAAAPVLPATQALLDGEAVAFGPRGVPDFGALQEALSTGHTDEVVYVAFDLLSLDGRDLRGEPLRERKRLLRELLDSATTPNPFRFADHFEGGGARFLDAACELGLEGAVSKRSDSPYRAGRTPDWRKTTCTKRQEFVVVGSTEPRGSRRGFGALLLGFYDDAGGLRYAGRVGSGFSERDLDAIATRLEPLSVDAPPALHPDSPAADPGGRRLHWVRPELVAEVEFAEWTSAGVLRQPRFVALREDRDPRTVRREEPPVARLTNPDKQLFPHDDTATGAAITKADLVAYYHAVAPAMLPHLAGRPLSVVRCPHGRTGECFFQKHPDRRGWPKQLPLVEVTGRDGEVSDYFYVEDAEGLAALVQLGVLEIHAWNSPSAAPATPDRIVFDLDPGLDVGPDEVRDAAFTLRDALDGIGLRSFVKTTGGRGLHVVSPILADAAISYDETRSFARSVVETLASAEPGRFTARMAKSARQGRIFIDYLRNALGATAIAAYSTRARPGAPVAVPITWEELAEKFEPASFDTTTVPERIARLAGSDPWEGYEEARRPLPR